MKTSLAFAAQVVLSIAIGTSALPVGAETYKMTTEIAPGVETPDSASDLDRHAEAEERRSHAGNQSKSCGTTWTVHALCRPIFWRSRS